MTYHVYPELHFHRELGVYMAFGLRAYYQRQLLIHIPDVFYHRQQAQDFARLCNREQPALIHLWDVIEDAM